MAIYLGADTPSAIYLGANAVSEIYVGDTKVWPLAAALSRDVKVLFLGDSTTAGVGADPSGSTDVNGSRVFSAPLKAKDWLNANGVPAIAESVATDNNVGWGVMASYRPDASFSGTQTASSRGNTIGGTLYRTSDVNGGLNFNPGIAFDSLEFCYVKASGFGAFNLVVDGGVHSNYSQSNATDQYIKQTISGLSLGMHTLGFLRSSGTIHGPGYVNVWNSAQKTVQIINAGARNWTTSDWISVLYPSRPLAALDVVLPDIVVIDIGINDYRQSGTTKATTKANIQTIISRVLANGGKVILCVPNPIISYNTVTDSWSQSAVLTMYQQLRDENPGVTLVDAPAAYFAAGLSGATNPATYGTLGSNMFDSFHPKAPVYAAEGDAVGAAIKAMIQSAGWM